MLILEALNLRECLQFEVSNIINGFLRKILIIEGILLIKLKLIRSDNNDGAKSRKASARFKNHARRCFRARSQWSKRGTPYLSGKFGVNTE